MCDGDVILMFDLAVTYDSNSQPHRLESVLKDMITSRSTSSVMLDLPLSISASDDLLEDGAYSVPSAKATIDIVSTYNALQSRE